MKLMGSKRRHRAASQCASATITIKTFFSRKSGTLIAKNRDSSVNLLFYSGDAYMVPSVFSNLACCDHA